MYKRQRINSKVGIVGIGRVGITVIGKQRILHCDPAVVHIQAIVVSCLLYTSDAADERSSVDLGGRRIIKKKKKRDNRILRSGNTQNKEN